MEWLSCIRDTIKYIEDNLMDENCAEDVLRQTYISPMLLQKGFQILTGYTITSYIRNRRLYLAACELQTTDRNMVTPILNGMARIITVLYGFLCGQSEGID